MTETKMFVEISTMGVDDKIPEDLSIVDPDIAHARIQGTMSFTPVDMKDKYAVHRACPYRKKLYREAYFYGHEQALTVYLKVQMIHISELLTEPFKKTFRNVLDMGGPSSILPQKTRL